jgi:multisubunit Na+/H+ antiporter MnhB subunit
MTGIVVFVVTLALGYGAYRVIRGGFRSPQSEKLNVFGVFGYVIVVVLAAWLLTVPAERFF